MELLHELVLTAAVSLLLAALIGRLLLPRSDGGKEGKVEKVDSLVGRDEEIRVGVEDEVLAALGYKVRSSDMAEVARKLEQLDVTMGCEIDGVNVVGKEKPIIRNVIVESGVDDDDEIEGFKRSSLAVSDESIREISIEREVSGEAEGLKIASLVIEDEKIIREIGVEDEPIREIRLEGEVGGQIEELKIASFVLKEELIRESGMCDVIEGSKNESIVVKDEPIRDNRLEGEVVAESEGSETASCVVKDKLIEQIGVESEVEVSKSVPLIQEDDTCKEIRLDSEVGDEEAKMVHFIQQDEPIGEITLEGEVGDEGSEIVSLTQEDEPIGKMRREGEVTKEVTEEGATREIGLEGEVAKEVIGDTVVGQMALMDKEEDDDWEGIERSEIGKLFVVANAFLDSDHGREALSRLSDDLQMQLYGLHKLATEGPCYEMQPMTLKVSARTKWHAWQKLGVMNPEVAMEEYITILSDNVPGWMETKVRDGSKQDVSIQSSEEALVESGVGFITAQPTPSKNLKEIDEAQSE